MTKSELRSLIREEIRKTLNEGRLNEASFKINAEQKDKLKKAIDFHNQYYSMRSKNSFNKYFQVVMDILKAAGVSEKIASKVTMVIFMKDNKYTDTLPAAIKTITQYVNKYGGREEYIFSGNKSFMDKKAMNVLVKNGIDKDYVERNDDTNEDIVELTVWVKDDIAEKIGRDRKSTRLNSSHVSESRMPSSA